MAVFDRFLNMISGKSSSVAGLIVDLVGPGKPLYTPRNFEQMAREGFSNNVYVFRAVLTVAQAASAIPWKLFREGRKLVEIDDHPILDLMRQPNMTEGGSAFWKKVFAYLYLSGNSYVEAVGLDNKPPSELWTLRPDRMRVIPDAKAFVGGYMYTVNGQNKQLDASQVLHWKLFNPTDDFYGLSPIVVASRLIDAMNAANDWNTALLQNYCRPPGALSVPTKLDAQQRELLKKDLKEKYSSKTNAGRPLLLENGMSWVNLATSPADMDWLQGKVVNAREIAIAIGVPPELLGDSANKTFSNMQEARKSLYSEVVLPLIYELRDSLNVFLVPQYGDDSLRLDVDTSNIEALQEDLQTKRTFIMDAYGRGLILLNEARRELGYDETPDGDVYFVPNTGTIVPEDEINPPEDEDNGPLPPAILPALLPAPQVQPPLDGITVEDDNVDQALKRSYRLWLPKSLARKSGRRTKQQKATHWSVIEAQRSRWYPEVAKHIKALLSEQRTTVNNAVKASQDVHDISSRMSAAVASYEDEFADILTAIYLHVGGPFAKQTYSALTRQYKRQAKAMRRKGIDLDDSAFDASDTILDWLQNYAGLKVKSINDTTLSNLQTALANGVAAGEGIADIAKRIDDLYLQQIIPNRSQVIAQTEVIGASNLGSWLGAKATGLELEHEWLASHDARVRESHADADGQSVPLETPYDVGDSQLMFPGDGSLGADAGEIVNCRCTEVYNLAEADQ